MNRMEKPEELETERRIVAALGLSLPTKEQDMLDGIDAIDANGKTYQIRHRINGPDLAFKLCGPGSRPWHTTTADYWIHVGPDGNGIWIETAFLRSIFPELEHHGCTCYHAGNQRVLFASMDLVAATCMEHGEYPGELS